MHKTVRLPLWRWATLGTAFALLAVLAGCGDTGSSSKKYTPYQGPAGVTFNVYDENFVPLSGANFYLDSGTSPIATTGSSGSVTIGLTGIHDLHITKPGYSGRSYINRNWSTVTTVQTLRITEPFGSNATTSTSGTAAPTSTGDGQFKMRFIRSDGISFNSTNITAAATSTPYSTPAFLGSNEMILFPVNAAIPASQAYAAYLSGLTIPAASVDPTVVHSTGFAFQASGTGGIPAAYMNTNYTFYRDPFGISALAFTGTNLVSGSTLSGDLITVPDFDTVYTGGSYSLALTSQTTAVNTKPVRQWFEIYRTRADIAAASATPSFTLPDYVVGVVGPTDGQVSTGTSPTFTWTLGGSPGFVEINLTEYSAAFTGYSVNRWQCWVFGGMTSVTYPAILGSLALDTSYSYQVRGRTNHLNSSNQYIGNDTDGWNAIRFSTGPSAVQ